MVKKYLDFNDRYPVIIEMPEGQEDGGQECEIPDDLWNEFVRLGDEFSEVERKIMDIMKGITKKDPDHLVNDQSQVKGGTPRK